MRNLFAVKTWAQIAVLGVIVTALAGCQSLTSLKNLEKPTVQFASINLVNAGLQEQEWEVALRVDNPNDRSITVKNIDYKLLVEGEEVARGMAADEITLAAHDSSRVTTRIHTSLVDTFGKLSVLTKKIQGEGIAYTVTGGGRLKGLPIPLSFEHEGTLDLTVLDLLKR